MISTNHGAEAMTIPELLQFIHGEFEAGAEPDHAANLRRFFKEAVDPYGVRGALIRKLAGPVYREIKNWPVAERDRLCEELWIAGKLESGILVTHLYRRFRKHCGAREFTLFERWLDQYVSNWAHTDGVAGWLLAASLENDPTLVDRLFAWPSARSRWKRRAAAVALLQEAKHGRHTEAIFKMAERLFADEDDMVRKGVGWLLKETYPKRPEATVEFLRERRTLISRLTLRYAAEKMSPEHRRGLMNLA